MKTTGIKVVRTTAEVFGWLFIGLILLGFGLAIADSNSGSYPTEG